MKITTRVVRAMVLSGVVVFALALLGGCQKEAAPEPQTAAPLDQPSAQAAQGPGGGTGGVTPLAPGTGAMSPVVGTEGMQGGGSAAGTVLKGKAKDMASQSPSSLNQLPDDEGN